MQLPSDANAWGLLPEVEGERTARLPAWARALARTLPRTTAATLEVDYAQRAGSPLDPRLRAKVRREAARANRSPYGEAYALADLQRAGGVDTLPGERVALDFARKLTTAADQVTDDEVAGVRQHFGDAGTVALVQCLAYANFQDRLVLSLGLPVEEGGPLPPVPVRFKKPYQGGVAPSRTPPRDSPGAAPSSPDAEWRGLNFDAVLAALEAQKGRPARIPVPSPEEVRRKLPAGMPDWPLRIQWSRVCMGYQPGLALPWTNALRTFEAEAKQDRVFEESLFWVVTRSLRCFY